jgi:hypothetical protein
MTDPSRRAILAGAMAACALAAVGCSGAAESVILIGGEKVDAASIDRDPLAVLPGGVILLGSVDTAAMFKTSLGGEVGKLAQNLIPIGAESNFVPSRDVDSFHVGVYAMQGADFCAVARGRFDVDAIRRAAEARAQTVQGVPLVKTRYADNDMYTAGNIGFVPLTSNTMLSGNETGMRRALDRMRFSKLERSIPGWMTDLAANKDASFTLAGDLGAQAPAAAVLREVPFLSGLRKVRVLGNFKPPGLNFAGAASYADDASAAGGAQALRNLQGLTQLMGLLSSLGFGASLPPMQVAQKSTDVAFTLPVDDRILAMLVRLAVNATTPAQYGAPR